MATKSFLKPVTLRGKKEAQAFIKAVERSQTATLSNKANTTDIARDLNREEIKKIFCSNQSTGEPS